MPTDVARRLSGRHAWMVFVADDLAAWLVGVLADAGRKKLAALVLGSDQERALRSAATTAVQSAAAELRPRRIPAARGLVPAGTGALGLLVLAVGHVQPCAAHGRFPSSHCAKIRAVSDRPA
jgi:hypothetical protein